MATYLFKLIRRKVRENQAKKAVPTTDESYLVPEVAPGPEMQNHSKHHAHDRHAAIVTSASGQDNRLSAEDAARHKEESAATIVSLVVGSILCVAFFLYEYLLGPERIMARLFPSQVAMIPSSLFRKKDTSLLMVINFSAGISFVLAFYFISYYWQLAESYSPSEAGLQLLYYTPGLGVGALSAMVLCNHWPRQTFFPLMWGSIVEGFGLGMLTNSVSIRNQKMVKVFLAVSGAGTGLRFMPVVLHAADIWSTRIPSMQSLFSFILSLGEIIGISIMGSVFSNKLDMYLSKIASQTPGFTVPSSGIPNLDFLNDLPLAAKEAVRDAAARAVMWALVSVLPFVGLSIIASIFLGNVWIGKAAGEDKDSELRRLAEKGKVMYELYLPALFTGSVLAHKQDLDVNLGHEEMERENSRDVEVNGGSKLPESVRMGDREV